VDKGRAIALTCIKVRQSVAGHACRHAALLLELRQVKATDSSRRDIAIDRGGYFVPALSMGFLAQRPTFCRGKL
jgi:hypothetical protein